MSKKDTSSKKYFPAVIAAAFYLIIFHAFPAQLKSQDKPSFDKPFKICRTFRSNIEFTQINASDNNKSFVFLNEENFFVSTNLETNLENWRSQSAGRLHPKIVSDTESIYYLSSFENDSRERTFTLNSISQKTGLTNWQKKLGAYAQLELLENSDENLLYLSANNHTILAVQKSAGNLNWTKNLKPKIISIDASQNEQLNILTKESLIKASKTNGEVLSEKSIKNSPTSHSIKNGAYILLGYPNGEFIKMTAAQRSNSILWKIKAGAGISSLIEIEDETLVSSLDNFLYLYSTESGKLKWKRRVSGRINIEPFTTEGFAIVVSSSDSIASIIELEGGKVINQIKIEDGNYFSERPSILGRFIIFPTFRGIYAFTNSEFECK